MDFQSSFLLDKIDNFLGKEDFKNSKIQIKPNLNCIKVTDYKKIVYPNISTQLKDLSLPNYIIYKVYAFKKCNCLGILGTRFSFSKAPYF